MCAGSRENSYFGQKEGQQLDKGPADEKEFECPFKENEIFGAHAEMVALQLLNI